MPKQVAIFRASKINSLRKSVPEKNRGNVQASLVHMQAFRHAGHGTSSMGSIWEQMIALSGDIRINTFLDLLHLTNYIEAISHREDDCLISWVGLTQRNPT